MPGVKYTLDVLSTRDAPVYICGDCRVSCTYEELTVHAKTHQATSISIDTNFEKLNSQ